MRLVTAAFAALWGVAMISSASAATAPPRSGPLTFEQDVRPILKAHCFTCHGEEDKLKGGLDLRLRHLIAKGGEHGAAITPGKPEQSRLFALVRDGEMPKGEKKLSREQVEVIRQWIATGAKVARPEPAKPGAADEFTPEERAWWAFQPVKRPPVPRVPFSVFSVQTGNGRTRAPPTTEHWKPDASGSAHPIDAFIGQKLAAARLTFSPPADRATLFRRASFDLTGLPPKPGEVDAFLTDDSPGAYERMLQRLLGSPHYGERWGRHWLDVAGYADSDGYTDADTPRRWSYKYRDYVVQSLNNDKPFDQFIREQLAGDELVPLPHKNLSPTAIEQLTATGFLRMVPDGTAAAGVEQKVARNAVIADTLKVVSSALLGLTVGCAECHNHRYDPIPQADYYRLRAIFEPALDPKNWRVPNARLVSLLTDTDRAQAAKVEVEARVLDVARLAKQEEFIGEILERELARRPEELRAPLREGYRTAAAKRAPATVALLKEHPTVMNLSPGSLYLYEQKKADELKRMADEAAKVREKKPVEEFVQPLTEPSGKVLVQTHVFHRGDPDQPKQAVKPGELTILASSRPVDFPEDDPALPSTGRRLAFAKSLTDGTHPLATRVLVNRVWMHHFGRGLVSSVGDFGRLGERPTHPELLDWLASEFVTQGWSLKQLHQLIMTSAAYRQSSFRDPKMERVDPENRWLWRMNVRRLEAETIRDATLAVSGRLNSKMAGAPVPIMTDESGQVVVGIDTNDTAGRPSGKFVSLDGEEFRRSLYVQVRRSKPLGLLETFDLPPMEPNCEARNASTVAPQSLALMNGEFTVSQASFMAGRVTKESGDSSDESKIARAWQLAFARRPASGELNDSLAFLAKQRAHFTANPAKAAPAAKGKESPLVPLPDEQALATLCQALLTANRFLYVD